MKYTVELTPDEMEHLQNLLAREIVAFAAIVEAEMSSDGDSWLDAATLRELTDLRAKLVQVSGADLTEVGV